MARPMPLDRREVCVDVRIDHPLDPEAPDCIGADRRPIEGCYTVDGADCASDGVDEKAGGSVLDQLGHRASFECDHRRAARHGLDDAVPERLVEPDQVQERVSSTEELERSSPLTAPMKETCVPSSLGAICSSK